MSRPGQPSWEKLSLNQLVDWAAGYILVAIGRGDYRQAVDAMIRQAFANGEKSKEAELAKRGPSRRRRRV